MNFEQKLAQTIIKNIETYETMVEFLIKRDDFEGVSRWITKKLEMKTLAMQMWGSDIVGQFGIDLIENLKKIANNPSESFKNQIMDAFQSGIEHGRNLEITIGEEAENYYNSLT
jgi:hypothetical protein